MEARVVAVEQHLRNAATVIDRLVRDSETRGQDVEHLAALVRVLREQFEHRFGAPMPTCTACGRALSLQEQRAGVKRHSSCGGIMR